MTWRHHSEYYAYTTIRSIFPNMALTPRFGAAQVRAARDSLDSCTVKRLYASTLPDAGAVGNRFGILLAPTAHIPSPGSWRGM